MNVEGIAKAGVEEDLFDCSPCPAQDTVCELATVQQHTGPHQLVDSHMETRLNGLAERRIRVKEAVEDATSEIERKPPGQRPNVVATSKRVFALSGVLPL